MALCKKNCDGITISGLTELQIEYSDDGGTTWTNELDADTESAVNALRFSTDGGDTWSRTATLPVPSTNELTRIVHYYSNGITGDTHSSGGTSYEELGTEYQMDNSSTVKLDTAGDSLLIEAYFEIPTNGSTRQVGIKIDTVSPGADSTDLVSHSLIPYKDTVVKLTAVFNRTQSEGAQYFEGKYEILGSPNVEVGQELNTLSIDFNVPDDIFIQPYAIEDTKASDDVVLKIFKVTLFKTQ